MAYRVVTRFDDENADVVTHRDYFSMLEKYGGGMGTGHSNGTSSMVVKDICLPELKKDLKQAGINLIRIVKL